MEPTEELFRDHPNDPFVGTSLPGAPYFTAGIPVSPLKTGDEHNSRRGIILRIEVNPRFAVNDCNRAISHSRGRAAQTVFFRKQSELIFRPRNLHSAVEPPNHRHSASPPAEKWLVTFCCESRQVRLAVTGSVVST